MASRKGGLLGGSGRKLELPPRLLAGWHTQEGRGEARGSGLGTADTNWFPSPLQSAIPFLIMVVVLDSNLIVTYIVAIAAGISVAAAFLLPW